MSGAILILCTFERNYSLIRQCSTLTMCNVDGAHKEMPCILVGGLFDLSATKVTKRNEMRKNLKILSTYVGIR